MNDAAEQRPDSMYDRFRRAAQIDADNWRDPQHDLEAIRLIDAMLHRIVRDPGVAAVHFAAMLLYLHGQASEPFDWEQRPFLLRFNPGDQGDRRNAFMELCQRIGTSSAPYLLHWP